MSKRYLRRCIKIPGLLLVICASGIAAAATPGLNEAGPAAAQADVHLTASGPDDRAAAVFDDLSGSGLRPAPAGARGDPGELQGHQVADAPRTPTGVMWFAGLVLILFQLYRKQRSLEQQPVA